VVPIGNKKGLDTDGKIKISFVENLNDTIKLLL
jgi:hypothetical protein